jgi:hypothetical protein
VNLEINSEGTDEEGYVASETERRVDSTVRRLHMEDNRWVVREREFMTDIFRHGNNLTAWVEDRLHLEMVVNERYDSTKG